jgi:polysaccharide biosynthesis/export protein
MGKPMHLFPVLLMAIVMASCVDTKKLTRDLTYFHDLPDSARFDMTRLEPKIEKGDILYINISSADPKTDAIFNATNYYQSGITNSAGTTGAGNAIGYLVHEDGNVTLPLLGNITSYGKTKTALAEAIKEKLATYTKDAIVTIRFLNYKITVIGEVARPGTFTIPNERVNILEAVGLAGDLTVFGKRENVLVIRENDGKTEFGKIDLNNKDIFKSQFYNLKQNDVVYIEMNDRKVINADRSTDRTLTILFSAISSVAIVVTAIATLTR